MTEGQHVEQQDETPRALSEEDSDMLKGFGFDPGIPVYAIDEIAFDLGQIKHALFDSTYRNPTILPFYTGSRHPGDDPGVELYMVLELVQAYYPPYAPILGMGAPLGCFNAPEWYLRGFLYKSPHDPYPEAIRMYVYIATGGSADDFNHAIVQVVRQPSGADPSIPLVYGKDIPGQNT